MRFKLITGVAFSVTCQGCQQPSMAGSESYQSASTGLASTPHKVYLDSTSTPAMYYCESCAASHADYEDPTRSVSQFYADTTGDKVL
jgi:hypothetical protein